MGSLSGSLSKAKKESVLGRIKRRVKSEVKEAKENLPLMKKALGTLLKGGTSFKPLKKMSEKKEPYEPVRREMHRKED